MKLLSMTDFVLRETNSPTTLAESFQRCVTYANFLKQPLKIEMFVPVDEYGNILQEPEEFKEWIKSDHYFNASESVTHQCRMYKKALEKVLFEIEYKYSAELIVELNTDIESIKNLDIELTPNTIKQLGL